MRIKKFKFSLAMIGMIVLGVSMSLGGCSSKDETTSQKAVDKKETTTTDEKLEVSIALMSGPKEVDTWMEKQLEEKYNVEIEFVVLPGWDDVQAKVNLLMADESQRPDVIWFNGMQKEFTQWVNAGILVDLTEYSKKYTNITDYYSTDTMFYNSTDEGKIYRIPGDVSEESCMTTLIRKDWLDNLDLEVPTTLEEYCEVLRKFTFEDPDGNGKDDTYGFANTGLEWRSFMPFMSPFNADPGNFVVQEDGTVVHGSIEPQVKEGLAVVAELYQEGCIEPTIINKNNGDELYVNGGYGSTYRWIAWLNPNDNNTLAFKKNNPGAEFVSIGPIKGEDGFSSDEPEDPSGWCYWGITKNCEDPERVYAMLDDMAAKENYIFRKWGVEGEHYKLVDGKFEWIISPEEQAKQGLGLGLMGAYVDRKDDANIVNVPEVTKIFEERAKTSDPFAERRVRFKESNRPVWAQYGTEIEKIRDEYFYGIIKGDKPIDAFDEYVEKFYQIGGEEVNKEATELYQKQKAQYDDFISSWKN